MLQDRSQLLTNRVKEEIHSIIIQDFMHLFWKFYYEHCREWDTALQEMLEHRKYRKNNEVMISFMFKGSVLFFPTLIVITTVSS